MKQANVTLAVIGGNEGGGGYVDHTALTPGEDFVFNVEEIEQKVFYIKAANAADWLNPFTGAVSSFSGPQTVLKVKVTSQIDG